eukprot:2519110-Alexandrium_andersonii.AAC.1
MPAVRGALALPSPRMPAVGRAGRWHRARRRLRCAATAAHHPCALCTPRCAARSSLPLPGRPSPLL